MYFDGVKVIDNDGEEKPAHPNCAFFELKKGLHILYLEGWTKSALLSVAATLKGPDTLNATSYFRGLHFSPDATGQIVEQKPIISQGQEFTTYIAVAVALGVTAIAVSAFVFLQLSQMTHAAVAPGMPAIHMEMTLDMSLSDITDVEKFKSQLISDIAKSVNLSSWQVQILSLRPGSVIVEFALRSSPNRRHTIEKAANSLKEQMGNPLSKLRRGQGTSSVLAIDTLPEQSPEKNMAPLKFDPLKQEAQDMTTKILFGKSSLDRIKAGLKGDCVLLLQWQEIFTFGSRLKKFSSPNVGVDQKPQISCIAAIPAIHLNPIEYYFVNCLLHHVYCRTKSCFG